MKILRFGEPGQEKPGLLDRNGDVRDLSASITDFNGDFLGDDALAKVRAIDPLTLPLAPVGARLGSPVAGVSKIIAVGLNYSDHAAETAMPLPVEPLLFMKATSALSGPYDPIVIPRNAVKTDWEVELAVIIGRKAAYVCEEAAMDYVAGYAVGNDVSERALQLERHGQWIKGKSNDSFAPIGPWLVTRDEIEDPQNLALWLEVNGDRVQSGSTRNMIFSVPQIVSYVSEFMTLVPGDVILTGTPAGVGMGRKPPRFLKAGDVVRLGVEGLGEQQQTCVAWARPA